MGKLRLKVSQSFYIEENCIGTIHNKKKTAAETGNVEKAGNKGKNCFQTGLQATFGFKWEKAGTLKKSASEPPGGTVYAQA